MSMSPLRSKPGRTTLSPMFLKSSHTLGIWSPQCEARSDCKGPGEIRRVEQTGKLVELKAWQNEYIRPESPSTTVNKQRHESNYRPPASLFTPPDFSPLTPLIPLQRKFCLLAYNYVGTALSETHIRLSDPIKLSAKNVPVAGRNEHTISVRVRDKTWSNSEERGIPAQNNTVVERDK
ncbi:hypothetical protein J6590_029483 [Homalodisca vitripennis]|nr:hypothetical protein J6590_029483 [Homalodisca vitripennis]